ncbi:MAG TPA: S-methyl-5'-thioadenosine phosphorylase [Thermodesulfovibrionales bacterium]|nr:S-methyl-5'-thioadenosine phosphorylase [Thermodesulfovibrionales bacterium]
MRRVGVIAGSGFYEMEGIREKGSKRVTSPFGDPSDRYRIYELSGTEVIFLSRHGSPHRIPPHEINYRANISGFREMGVERIYGIHAVGGMNRGMKPGDIVIPDQIVDLTHSRAATFYSGSDVVHIDFTTPYCDDLRALLFASGRRGGIELRESGTYVCVNGPRLETAAEIRAFAGMGGDVVGMTGMPEASLARELAICFAGIAVVTNYAAGISEKRLTTREVVETMKVAMGRIRALVRGALEIMPENRACECAKALDDARMQDVRGHPLLSDGEDS